MSTSPPSSDHPGHAPLTPSPSDGGDPRVPLVLKSLVIILALVTVGMVLVTWPEKQRVTSASGQTIVTVKAKVTAVEAVPCTTPGESDCVRATFDVLDGASAGEVGSIVGGDGRTGPRLAVGDTIRVAETPEESRVAIGGMEVERWTFSDFDRQGALLWLVLLFVVIVLIAGRLKGLRALLGLGLSCVVILMYLVPGLLHGGNSVLIACTAALMVMFLTIPLAHGWGLTTVAATLGTASSLAITVALAVLFTNLAKLTGYSDESAIYLSASVEQVSIQGLLLAGIVIAALGVLDDVTISQASTVLALRHANPSLTFRQLFGSAVKVGRDHITATINTLVLAYAGASLSTLLVFAVVDIPALQALNGENVAAQVVGTLVGSIGLIAAMPITTGLAALLALHTPVEEIDPHAGHAH